MKKLILLYAGVACLFSLFTYLFIDVNLPFFKPLYTGIALSNRPVVSVVYALFIVLLFFFYCLFLQSNKMTLKNLKYLVAISLALFIISYPAIISYDIFNYTTTAKVTFVYKENPYLVMPIEFTHDQFLLYTRAANKYALYGPFWILLTGVPLVVGMGSFIPTLFLFKLLLVPFYMGTTYLLYKLSNKNVKVAAFFALNPLCLIETFVSGHNDIVMVFFALLSFYLVQNKRKMLGSVSLLLSILIKYATLFLVPVFIYTFWKESKHKEITWDKVWKISFVSMGIIFLLSPIREELYPWYALWILPFGALINHKKLNVVLGVLSFGLMLFYIPYMLLGQYLGVAFVLKYTLVLMPVLASFIYITLAK